MNVGQVLETHLGWVAKPRLGGRGRRRRGPKGLAGGRRATADPGTRVATPVFDGVREEEITGLLDSTLPRPRRRPR